MLKHIVMWKIKEDLSKEEIGKEMKSQLEGLCSRIKEIVKIEVGLNIKPDAQAFDVILYSEFNNMNDLEAYQKHPDHLKVVDFIKSVTKERAFVDYNG